ncbi:MAG: acyl-CoA carboxylase subunit epsilon [Actinobacteria bacterium]|nr:acyl-CoA carboxylase subunit epsilon [Actinomycetota bacterium]
MRIVAGMPTDEEIGVIVAVLAARSAARPTNAQPVSLWANKARLTRPSIGAGPGAWRASAMPR